VVEEIIGRLSELTESQLRRLEDEIRRERQRRTSSAGGRLDASRDQEGAALPLTEVLGIVPTRTAICSWRYAATSVATVRPASADRTGTSSSTRAASARSSTSARPATRRVLWLPSGGSRRTCCPCRLRYLPLRSTPLLSRGQNHPWLAATFKKQCLARAAHHWFYPGGTAWWTASTLLPTGSNT